MTDRATPRSRLPLRIGFLPRLRRGSSLVFNNTSLITPYSAGESSAAVLQRPHRRELLHAELCGPGGAAGCVNGTGTNIMVQADANTSFHVAQSGGAGANISGVAGDGTPWICTRSPFAEGVVTRAVRLSQPAELQRRGPQTGPRLFSCTESFQFAISSSSDGKRVPAGPLSQRSGDRRCGRAVSAGPPEWPPLPSEPLFAALPVRARPCQRPRANSLHVQVLVHVVAREGQYRHPGRQCLIGRRAAAVADDQRGSTRRLWTLGEIPRRTHSRCASVSAARPAVAAMTVTGSSERASSTTGRMSASPELPSVT